MKKTLILICALAVPDGVRGHGNYPPIAEFEEDYYRAVDCWDCFYVGGRMCHGKGYENIQRYTYSSNIYNSVCCKPGSTDPFCDGSLFDCSMDSIGDTGGKYKDVLTGGFNF